jgi:hypothetical protein
MSGRLVFAGLAAFVAGLISEPTFSQTQQSVPLPQMKVGPAHHPQYLAPTGRRKPPGAPLDERGGTAPSVEQQESDIKQHTLKSICKDAPGCEGGHLRR